MRVQMTSAVRRIAEHHDLIRRRRIQAAADGKTDRMTLPGADDARFFRLPADPARPAMS
jgi:hypothetical protein